jgi:hypothetical protein
MTDDNEPVQGQSTPFTRVALSVETAPTPDTSPEILERLLRMADNYRTDNSSHQAIAILLELAERYAETPEGRLARNRLMAIAAEYENQGKLHQARGLYERLL